MPSDFGHVAGKGFAVNFRDSAMIRFIVAMRAEIISILVCFGVFRVARFLALRMLGSFCIYLAYISVNCKLQLATRSF